MTNKDFLNSMSAQMGMKKNEVQRMVENFTACLAENMEDGDVANIQGFGSFEMRKKKERVVVNPSTKKRQLVPPKLSISFKPSATLKDRAL